MKAMYLEKPGLIVEKELPMPSLAPNEVLVKVKAVGICGSDVEYYTNGRIGNFVVKAPIILGHEVAGEIVDTGQNVTSFQIGDRVALEPGIPCQKCEFCKSGRYNLCPHIRFMGTPPIDGAFREYIAHPEAFTYKIPEYISFEEAALLEPLSVGLHAARRANVQPGDTVAILGAGPIGLVTLQAVRLRGAAEVLVTDLVDFRLSIAKDFGATEVVNVGNVNKSCLANYLKACDVVIQTATSAEACTQAFDFVKRGGRIVQVGHPPVSQVPIDPNLLIAEELDLVGSFRYTNTYPAAVKLLGAKRIDVKPLISQTFPLQELQVALEHVRKHPDRCLKVMIIS